MSTLDPVTVEWLTGSVSLVKSLDAAEGRFHEALASGPDDFRTALTDLEETTRNARAWLSANPCPKDEGDRHLSALIGAYGNIVAVTKRALRKDTDSAAVYKRIHACMIDATSHVKALHAMFPSAEEPPA